MLPVKRLDDAKQRLAALLEPAERRALMAAMFADVLAALRQVETEHELVVVTRDPEARRSAHAHGAHVVADRGGAGHSAAAALGIGTAVARGAERVVLIPGDCPLLDAAELDELLGLAPASGGQVVVVPDREGAGTNALLLEPPGIVAPSFGPGSRVRHLAAAGAAGVPVQIRRPASLTLDVDTPADLCAVAEALAARRHAAPRTAAVLAGLSPAGLAAR